jgi:hypothetical protein
MSIHPLQRLRLLLLVFEMPRRREHLLINPQKKGVKEPRQFISLFLIHLQIAAEAHHFAD